MNRRKKEQERMLKGLRVIQKGELGPLTSDSVAIAWPTVLRLIDDYQMDGGRVLDFVCGTGAFCRRMKSEGLRVEGFDPSALNIRAAVKDSSRQIRFHGGDRKALARIEGKFDVITAIMAFPFIADLDSYIPLFDDLLVERGLLVFTVFNPDFVESCFRGSMVFRSMRTVGKTAVASMELKKGATVDTYVRNKDDYKKIFERHGFEYLSSRYPPFTPEFVDKYRWKLPSDDAAYLAMAVRKK